MSSHIETRCIHGDPARRTPDTYDAVSFPIYQTATFSHREPGHNASGFDYTRESNPTRQRLEEVLSALEGAADTVAFSSGMAAIGIALELFRPGDHILCSDDLYGGTIRLHNLISKKNGLELSYVDTTDLQNVERALRPNTKAIYIETPSNPMMHITDIHACSALAHEKGLLLIVDNTFLSPYFQRPLDLGADLVVHSGSKFLSGHNDVISGFVCAKTPESGAKLRLLSKTIGAALSPFDAWLTLRGTKTLAVRMAWQQKTAGALALWLKKHPKVRRVYYPGLPEHQGYDVQSRQATGYGSMISFHVDSAETAIRVLRGVKTITFAESLGGTETLLTYPLVQTHPDVPPETRERLGITDTLLRISVGLEHLDDLILDLEQGLG